MLGPPHLRQGTQLLQDRLGHGEGVPPPMASSVRFAIADARQEFLLGFLAKTVHPLHLPFDTRPVQVCDRADPELFMQHLDFFRSQSRNLQQLDQPWSNRCFQLVEELQPACRMQFGDLFRQRLANAFDSLQTALCDHRVQILLQGLQRPRPRMIGADLEKILVLQLQQNPDLV